MPVVVETPGPLGVVDSVKLVLPSVSLIKYTMLLVYPAIDPVPPKVPLMVMV